MKGYMTRKMKISEVVAALEIAIEEYGRNNFLSISVRDGVVNGVEAKVILVNHASTQIECLGISVAILGNIHVVFDPSKKESGIYFCDEVGQPTLKPQDIISLKIGQRFCEIIGNSYFFTDSRR